MSVDRVRQAAYLLDFAEGEIITLKVNSTGELTTQSSAPVKTGELPMQILLKH